MQDFHSVQKGLSVTWSFSSNMEAPLFPTITWHHLFCPWHTGSVWALIFQNYHLPQGLCIVYSCCLESTCSLLASCLVFFGIPISVLPVGSLDKKNNLYQLSPFNVIYLLYNMCSIGYVVLLFLFDHILCPWWFLETLVFHQPVLWTSLKHGLNSIYVYIPQMPDYILN